MSDLPKCIDNAHITMYADDTSSSTTVKTCDDIKKKVIPNFFSVIDWLKANKLSLNTVSRLNLCHWTQRQVFLDLEHCLP